MAHKRNYNYMHCHQDHMPHKSAIGHFSQKVALLLWVISANYVRKSPKMGLPYVLLAVLSD